MLTGLEYGEKQESLMKIYRIYLRSKLDYVSIVYSSGGTRELRALDVVCNEALRIATGAFKSTPVENLFALTQQMTPQERRDFLNIRFYLKFKASLSNPRNKCIIGCNVNLFRNHHENPFSIRVINISSSHNLPHFIEKVDFSYLIHNPKICHSQP